MNSWNDDRLDELSARTEAGFKEVKEEIKEVNQRFDRLTNAIIIGASVGLACSILVAGILG